MILIGCYIKPLVNWARHYLQKSIERLLHTLKTVLDWQTSCNYVFAKAAHFQRKAVEWQLSRFYYHPAALNPTVFDPQKVLSLLQEWQGPSDNPYMHADAKHIIFQALTAKVHAEAALMDWIVMVKVGPPTFHVKFNYPQNYIPVLGCSFKSGLAHWC